MTGPEARLQVRLFFSAPARSAPRSDLHLLAEDATLTARIHA